MSSLSPLREPVSSRKVLRLVPSQIASKTLDKAPTRTRTKQQTTAGSLTALSETAPSPTAFSDAATVATAASLEKSSLSEVEIPLHELPNNALVLRCQNQAYRDRAAFEELVNRYQRYVDKLLYHLASDWSDRADLAQEIWIRVYRSIHRLKEPAKFKSWLGRITTNLFYDELRKRKRFKGSVSLDAPRHSADGQYEWELPSDEPTPADTMMTQEFHDYLKAAMAELPEVFQKTIAMRELQGLSYEEIANITGVSLGTVKSRIARARQRLQEKLNVYLTPGQVTSKKA
ncbi:MAG: sigma-70 family RNA polymerase sigma factor [Phormidesmis sp.]